MGVDRSDYIIYGWKLPYEIQTMREIKLTFMMKNLNQ